MSTTVRSPVPWLAAPLAFVLACGGGENPGITDSPSPTTTGTPDGEPTTTPEHPTGGGSLSTSSTTADATTTTSETTNATTGPPPPPGPFCGDSHVDPEEECDLGPDNSDLGPCTHQCALPFCGDGLLWIGVEACDEGAANEDAYGKCQKNCTLGPRCGDGVADYGHEECDQGENNGKPAPDGSVECTGCRWNGRLVFVSSAAYNGVLGNLSDANLKCRDLAAAAGFEHAATFRAWLSDGVEGPLTQFKAQTLEGQPYVTLDGRIVAADFSEIVMTGLRTGISRTEKNDSLTGAKVWTHTTGAGVPIDAPAGPPCGNWLSDSDLDEARVGYNAVEVEDGAEWDAWRMQRWWTTYSAVPCDKDFHLYCFEDAL